MTWVLLRGLTRESRHWDSFIPQLEQAVQEPVLPLDLPGNGTLNGFASPVTVEAITGHARQQLQGVAVASSLQPPFKLLGMSLGGMVAADWAQRYPDEVSRLALVNTSMRPFSGPAERLRPRSWLALARLACHWGDAVSAEEIIHRLTCNRTARVADDVAQWRLIRRSAPVSLRNALCQLGAAARFTAPRSAPRCPVLVLSSDQDQLVNPVCSKRLADAWQAAHRQHRWAGHDLPHDDGDWLAQQLSRWDRDGASWQNHVIR